MDGLLADRHIILCTGSGGVGKTTSAAALAVRAADAGRRVVVCTIDPAARLAQSLGLDRLSGDPVPVSLPRVRGTTGARGELHALVLDMKATFDSMIHEMASPERAAAILSNPFYGHVSSSLAGTQEYMAMQKLWELHESGRWELIIIDTPPGRSALDFLDAPRRITDFLDGRFLRMLLLPTLGGRPGLRVFSAGTNLLVRTVGKITGSELLGDVASFFRNFEGMYGDFRTRAHQVRELLRARHTSFVVVTTPTDHAVREARAFVDRLETDALPIGGIIVNRTHDVVRMSHADAVTAGAAGGVTAAALSVHGGWRAVARREEELLRGAFGTHPVWRVPDLVGDVHDLRVLRRIGALLADASASTSAGAGDGASNGARGAAS